MDHKHLRYSLEMLWNDVERLRRIRNGPDQTTIDRLRGDLVALQSLLGNGPPYALDRLAELDTRFSEIRDTINGHLFSRM